MSSWFTSSLIAMLGFLIYSLSLKFASSQDPLSVAFFIELTGLSIISALLVLRGGLSISRSFLLYPLIAGVGVVLIDTFTVKAFSSGPTPLVATVIFLYPIFLVPLSSLLFNEQLKLHHIVGILLGAISMVLLNA